MNKDVFIERMRARLLDGIGVPEPTNFVPDEFQQAAISSVIEEVDTLVVAPTGAGKTFIALKAIEAALAKQARSVYTTPLKALSNTKYAELKRRFEPAAKVGLLTGDRKIDTDADVVIATTEIYRNELYSTRANYTGGVLGEVHFIAYQQVWPVC